MKDKEYELQLHRPTVAETVKMTVALASLVAEGGIDTDNILSIELVGAGYEDIDSLMDLAEMVGEVLGINVAAALNNECTAINVAVLPDTEGFNFDDTIEEK